MEIIIAMVEKSPNPTFSKVFEKSNLRKDFFLRKEI